MSRPLLLILCVLVLLAACGQESDRPRPPAAPAKTQLAITVWPEGQAKGQGQSYTVSCGPEAATAREAKACTTLDRLGAQAFAPVPADVACTEIYGGPAEATVKGVVAGAAVETTLNLVNGCEAARWERVKDVVPIPEQQLLFQ